MKGAGGPGLTIRFHVSLLGHPEEVGAPGLAVFETRV